MRAELAVFTLLLAVLNLPLFIGRTTAGLAFRAEAVANGEWWRLLTHAFVHISWYHLLLDGAAFLFLYANLQLEERWRRLLLVAGSAAGSLLAAWCVSPLITAHGLCGLSGVAHGLMAVSAVEMLALPGANRGTRVLGLASFALVITKCIIEAATGHALFAGMHFDLLGTPVVVCHAGGVLGAVVTTLLCRGDRAVPIISTVTSGAASDAHGQQHWVAE
jgi:rhomboid family GlyGly-CTERM serine protease